MHRDRLSGGEAFVKVVALHHARHRVFGGQLDHAGGTQGLAPFAVVADLGLGRVQHHAGLAVVGFGIELDLLGREGRARAVAARRIADQAGEIPDEEDHLVAQILQLPHLVQHHGVADVDVGRGGVQPQLDAQRLARRFRPDKLLEPFVLGQQFLHAPQRNFEGLSYTIRDRGCCNSRLIHKGFLGCLYSMRRYTPAHIA